MTKRNRFYPILLGATLSLAASPVLPSRAEPGVPNDNSNTAPAVTAPPPAPAPVAPTTLAPAQATAPSPAPSGKVMTAPDPTAVPATYTVVTGDSYWTISKKFGCTVDALKKANNAKKNSLKPGQVIKIPHPKDKTATTPAVKPDATTAPRKKSQPKVYAKAQQVQDFDMPASTLASCPVPDPALAPDKAVAPTHTDSTVDTASDSSATSAPVAQLVSPAEMDADAAAAAPKVVAVTKPTPKPTPIPAPVVAATKPAPIPAPAPIAQPSPSSSSVASSFTSSSSKQSGHNSFFSSSPSSSSNQMSSDWATRFMQQARDLSSLGLQYDQSWRPPGESHAWAMDCSNTSRYLYKVTANIELPRTASDQYYYLHLQNKAWDVPQASDGYADMSYLRDNLKPGDLLFWENTYRPERQPPITHVMVFLGTNEKGEWLMVGSQSSRGGMHNHHNGGPDIYVFDPHKPSGGYTTWMGLVRHKGRFCAYGRPLEANPAKLSVASN